MKDTRWGWVLLGALLANVAVTAIITPIAIMDGQERLGYVAPPASFVGLFLVAWWIARKAPQRAALHGLLVGLIAMLLYLPIELSQEVTVAHYLSSVLKVLGGAAGGLIAARRAAAEPATPPPTTN